MRCLELILSVSVWCGFDFLVCCEGDAGSCSGRCVRPCCVIFGLERSEVMGMLRGFTKQLLGPWALVGRGSFEGEELNVCRKSGCALRHVIVLWRRLLIVFDTDILRRISRLVRAMRAGRRMQLLARFVWASYVNARTGCRGDELGPRSLVGVLGSAPLREVRNDGSAAFLREIQAGEISVSATGGLTRRVGGSFIKNIDVVNHVGGRTNIGGNTLRASGKRSGSNRAATPMAFLGRTQAGEIAVSATERLTRRVGESFIENIDVANHVGGRTNIGGNTLRASEKRSRSDRAAAPMVFLGRTQAGEIAVSATERLTRRVGESFIENIDVVNHVGGYRNIGSNTLWASGKRSRSDRAATAVGFPGQMRVGEIAVFGIERIRTRLRQHFVETLVASSTPTAAQTLAATLFGHRRGVRAPSALFSRWKRSHKYLLSNCAKAEHEFLPGEAFAFPRGPGGGLDRTFKTKFNSTQAEACATCSVARQIQSGRGADANLKL